MPSPRTDPFDQLFRELPASYRAVAVSLRATIRGLGPGLVERVKWNNPFWIGNDDVLCLQCFPDHVNLGFLRGADLAAAHPEIRGTGKSMRHFPVRTLAEARSSLVKTLVRAAIELDRSSTARARPPGRK